MAKKKWIQEAINPKHKGYCTPMTKSTCTPRRKALAKRFKSGDLSKKQNGGYTDDQDFMMHDNELYQTGGSLSHVFLPSGTYDTDAQQSYDRMLKKGFAQDNSIPTPDQFMQTDRGKQIVDKYKKMGYDVTPDATTGQLKFRKGIGDWQDNPYTEMFNKAASFATGVGNLFQGGKQRIEEKKQLNQSMTPKYFQNMQSAGLNNVPAYMEYGGDITYDRSTYYGSGIHGEGMSYPVKQVSVGQNRDIYSEGVVEPTERTYEEVPQPTYNRRSGTGSAIKPHYGPGYMFGGRDNTFNRQPVMSYGGWDQVGFMMEYGGEPDYMMYGGMGEGMPYDDRDMTNIDYGYQGIHSNNPYGHMSMYYTGGKVPAGYHEMPDGSIMSDSEMMKTGGVTSEKAKEILRDGTVHGKALTPKQKRYFGWIAGGSKPRKEYGGWNQEGFMFQTGGFTPQEQGIVDQYKAKGYDVTKENGQLKFKKIGASQQQAPISGGAMTPPQIKQQPTEQPKQQIPVAGTQQSQQTKQIGNRIQLPDYGNKESRKAYAGAFREKYGQDLLKGYGDIPLRVNEKPVHGSDTSRNLATKAAQSVGLDPALMYASSMIEGQSGLYSGAAGKNEQGQELYRGYTGDKEYPVSGLWGFGLDSFEDYYPTLVKKGYLPKDFDKQFKIYEGEGGPEGSTGGSESTMFKSTDAGIQAKAAMMRAFYDELDNYANKKGIKLTPEQRDYFGLAHFNSGAHGYEMLDAYNKAGLLKDNKFINKMPNINVPFKYKGKQMSKEASEKLHKQIYGNVAPRLAAARGLKEEGLFESGGKVGYMEYGGKCDDCGKKMKFKNGGVSSYSHDSRKLPYYRDGGKKMQTDGYGVGDELELTPEQIAKLRKAGYQIEEI